MYSTICQSQLQSSLPIAPAPFTNVYTDETGAMGTEDQPKPLRQFQCAHLVLSSKTFSSLFIHSHQSSFHLFGTTEFVFHLIFFFSSLFCLIASHPVRFKFFSVRPHGDLICDSFWEGSYWGPNFEQPCATIILCMGLTECIIFFSNLAFLSRCNFQNHQHSPILAMVFLEVSWIAIPRLELELRVT